MKQTMLFIALVLLLCLPAIAPASELGDIRVSYLEGDAQMKTEETDDWVPLALHTPLRSGDRLWVPDDSHLELQLRDGTYVRLAERTSLDVLNSDRDSFQFSLTGGGVYVNFAGLKGRVIQMDTPLSSVRVFDRAAFRIDVEDDGYTNISVFRGAAFAESRNGRTRVSAGKNLSLGADATADLLPLGREDGWERWNRDRDLDLAERQYSSRYLPDELDVYAPDFDANGKWIYTPDYGYVWTPTVSVAVNWAPYSSGRWIWRGGDYVWIASEPWGWAPYHYGRWAYTGAIGWYWVPPARGAVYWGPGYVGWVQTPTYISWVPLAPGEVYYGYGAFGPNSVNLLSVTINRSEFRPVYRNIHAHNAVSIVARDTFLTGRRVDLHIGENPFLRERINIGRPDLRPDRRTFSPVVRDIPATKLPPAAVRQLQTSILKERRPLVLERNRSVFQPQGQPKSLPLKLRDSGKTERSGVDLQKVLRAKPERQKAPATVQQNKERLLDMLAPGAKKDGHQVPDRGRGQGERRDGR